MDIHEIKRVLDGLEEELIARVPEHLFVGHILPLLAGDPGHTSLEPWNHLAGSPFNKMAVYGGNGEVLFTLPPIAVSPNLSSDRDARTSLFEIMGNYDLRAKVSPIMARQYLEGALADKIERPERRIGDLKIVDEILVRYGREPRLPQSYYDHMEGRASSGSPTATSVADEVGDDL